MLLLYLLASPSNTLSGIFARLGNHLTHSLVKMSNDIKTVAITVQRQEVKDEKNLMKEKGNDCLPVYALSSIWSLESIKNVNESSNIYLDRLRFTVANN
jgi:hypothetical protein